MISDDVDVCLCMSVTDRQEEGRECGNQHILSDYS